MIDLSDREHAAALDADDPLAALRWRFSLPEGVIYLAGNSLGPPPHEALARVEEVLRREWAGDGVRSWSRHGWMELPTRVARTIAPMIGASHDEVEVTDSTSVTLFNLLACALRLRPERSIILSENGNFPTDLYMARGITDLIGDRVALRLVDRADLLEHLDRDVAVLMLTHVDFRTGEMHDMMSLTAAAHAAGALVLWDLSHSVGAVPIDMGGCNADLAVGCGYKYLNGGPGAPAFGFAARRHHAVLQPALQGWMGHDAPFDFSPDYRPSDGVARLRCGTPAILSLAALEIGAAVIAEAGVHRLREKSTRLAELFIDLVEGRGARQGLRLASPREAARRGSQVAFRHQEGYAIVQALAERGIIADFREPDLLRFGLAPAYLRFVDIWDAAAALGDVLERRLWDRPAHHIRAKVT